MVAACLNSCCGGTNGAELLCRGSRICRIFPQIASGTCEPVSTRCVPLPGADHPGGEACGRQQDNCVYVPAGLLSAPRKSSSPLGDTVQDRKRAGPHIIMK